MSRFLFSQLSIIDITDILVYTIETWYLNNFIHPKLIGKEPEMATLMAEPTITNDRLEEAIERITRLLAGEKPGAPLTVLKEDVRLIRAERSADSFWYPRIGYTLRLIHEIRASLELPLEWATKLLAGEPIEGFTLDAMREKIELLYEHLDAYELLEFRVDEAKLKYRLVADAVEVMKQVLADKTAGTTSAELERSIEVIEQVYGITNFTVRRLDYARDALHEIKEREIETERRQAAHERRTRREANVKNRAERQRLAAAGMGAGRKGGGGKKGR